MHKYTENHAIMNISKLVTLCALFVAVVLSGIKGFPLQRNTGGTEVLDTDLVQNSNMRMWNELTIQNNLKAIHDLHCKVSVYDFPNIRDAKGLNFQNAKCYFDGFSTISTEEFTNIKQEMYEYCLSLTTEEFSKAVMKPEILKKFKNQYAKIFKTEFNVDFTNEDYTRFMENWVNGFNNTFSAYTNGLPKIEFNLPQDKNKPDGTGDNPKNNQNQSTTEKSKHNSEDNDGMSESKLEDGLITSMPVEIEEASEVAGENKESEILTQESMGSDKSDAKKTEKNPEIDITKSVPVEIEKGNQEVVENDKDHEILTQAPEVITEGNTTSEGGNKEIIESTQTPEIVAKGDKKEEENDKHRENPDLSTSKHPNDKDKIANNIVTEEKDRADLELKIGVIDATSGTEMTKGQFILPVAVSALLIGALGGLR